MRRGRAPGNTNKNKARLADRKTDRTTGRGRKSGGSQEERAPSSTHKIKTNANAKQTKSAGRRRRELGNGGGGNRNGGGGGRGAARKN